MSLYKDYSENTRSIRLFSLLYPEPKSARFFGMVPETLRISSQDVLGLCDEDPFPSMPKLG